MWACASSLGDVCGSRRYDPRIPMERITEPWDSSDEPRGLWCVANRGAHLGYQVVQARV